MIRPLWFPLLAAGLAAGDVPRIDLLAPSGNFPSYGENLTIADLDRDGDLDLINLPNNSTSNSSDPHAYWIENLGSRRFAPLRLVHLAPTDTGEYLYSPAVINLNGDGAPEFFVSRATTSAHEPLALARALGGPAPAQGTVLAAATASPWHALDLDGDNQGELIQTTIVNGTSSAIRILRRQNDGSPGTFTEALVMESELLSLTSVQALDLDADGDLELCIESDGWILVFERTGPNAFKPEPLVFAEVYPDRMPWIDLNGDGLTDLLYPDGSWQANLGGLEFQSRAASPAFALLEIGNSVFNAITPRPGLPALVHSIPLPVAGDDYELLTAPFDTGEPISRLVVPGSDVTFIRYADLDGNGHLDLLHSYSTNGGNNGSRVLAVAWGSAAGLSAPQVIFAGPSDFHRVFAADFNRDKCMDLIDGPDALGHYRIRYNQGQAGIGDGLLLDGLEIPGTRLRILGVARMDKDKCLDLVCNYTRLPAGPWGGDDAIVVVRGRKDGSFIKPVIPAGGLPFATGPTQEGEFIDWDRDGDLDLVGWGLWRENVKGSFPPGQRFLVDLGTARDFLGNPITIGGTITGDLDGDHVPDIISLIYGEGELSGNGGGLGGGVPKKMLIAYNDGRGGIDATVELPATLAGVDFFGNLTVLGTAVVADLNADKLPDIWIREVGGTDFLGNPVTRARWLRNPGKGSRDPNTWVSQPLANTVAPGVALADFDGDGKTEWVSPTGYLKPTKQGPFFSQPFDFTGDINLSKESFSTAVDIDADRDADFIIGGRNTPLLVLYNPSADGSKRRAPKPRAIRWLPLPAVR